MKLNIDLTRRAGDRASARTAGGSLPHRLLDRGLTPRKVALIFYALCSVAAVFSLCMASQHFEGLAILLFCAATWIGIQHLGYVELAGRMFLEGAFRRMLRAQINLQQYQQLLADAETPQECWAIVETAAREFGLESNLKKPPPPRTRTHIARPATRHSGVETQMAGAPVGAPCWAFPLAHGSPSSGPRVIPS
jgi:hypothetical protein